MPHFVILSFQKIDPDHIILLENSRYQPHNFILDQEIRLFIIQTLSVL